MKTAASITSDNSEVVNKLENVMSGMEGDVKINDVKMKLKGLIKELVSEKKQKERFREAFVENEQKLLIHNKDISTILAFNKDREENLADYLQELEDKMDEMKLEITTSKKESNEEPEESGEDSTVNTPDYPLIRGIKEESFENNQRNFASNVEFWTTILDTFAKDTKGNYRIPKVGIFTAFGVLTSKHKILGQIQKLVENKPLADLYTRIFETGRILLDYGVTDLVLPEIFCGQAMTLEEKRLIQQRPKARNNLTQLLDWIDGSYNKISGREMQEKKARQYVNTQLAKRDVDLQLVASELKTKYVASIVRTMNDFHTLSLDQLSVLHEQIAKDILQGELKLNYQKIYDKALENGILGEKVIDMASKLQGTFLVFQKNKAQANTAKIDKRHLTTKKSQPKKKLINNIEKPKSTTFPTKKPTTRFFQKRIQKTFPRKEAFRKRSFPKKEYKRDTKRLIPIQGQTGLFRWSSKDGRVKNITIPCRYHRQKGDSAEKCFMLNHCWECSRPNFLSPPINKCEGSHQWKRKERTRKKQ